MIGRRLLASLVTAVTLGGCASNELLRLQTGDFIEEAQAPVAAARAVATERLNLERDTYATLYTLDSNCALVERKIRLLRSIDARNLRFCAAQDDSGFSIGGPVSPQQLARDQAGVRLVSSYIAALSKAVALPEATAKADFEQVIADINLFKSALGGANPSEPAAAFGTLISFVEKLKNEAESADKIRAVIAAESGNIDAAFASLAETLAMDEAINAAQRKLHQKIVAALFDASGNCGALPSATRCDPYVRHALTAVLFAIEDAQYQRNAAIERCKVSGNSDADCAAPSVSMMKAAAAAHTELVNLTKDRLSDKQRARQSKLAFRRFMDTLGVFVKLRPFV